MVRLSKVKGHSMSPSYLDGDYLLSVPLSMVRLKKGDVIIIKHAVFGYLVKEIRSKSKEGYYVQGMHPLSTDSRSIGMVLPKMIKGKVIAKIPVNSDWS